MEIFFFNTVGLQSDVSTLLALHCFDWLPTVFKEDGELS